MRGTEFIYERPHLKRGCPVSAFLDATELVTLTGYKRPADQIRFLEARGIPHTVNALRRPVVRRDLETEVAEPDLGPIP